MSSVSSSVDSSVLAGLGLSAASAGSSKAKSLSQDDFLKLMTAQLQNQDPLKPLDNSEFVSQMAQFSTVSGIQGLQNSFSGLSTSLTSSQALQASSLIGHSVLVPSSTLALTAGSAASGAADLPASGDAIVRISDANGQIIRSIDLGTQSAGLVQFQWDGLDANGQAAAAGDYNLSVNVTGNGTTQAANNIYSAGKVGSVSLNTAGALTLNVNGVGNVALSTVRQIM